MLHQELELFNPHLVDGAKGCLVIGTKIDMIGGSETAFDKITACLTDAANQAGLQSARTLLISARRGDNVDRLAAMIADLENFK